MSPYLPPGFWFKPTDLELINNYLLPKVLGEQLPSDAVIEGEVYGDNAQLPEGNGSGEELYLFVKTKKNQKRTKTIRLARNGYWKVTGNKKNIFDKSRKHICTKRSLVFKRKSNSRRKKNLLMDEYSLTRSIIQNNSEEWVLCRIKQSNRSPEMPPNSQEEEDEGDDLTSIDLDHNCKQIENNRMQQYPVEIAEGPSPASVEIDGTKSVDIDDVWKLIEDNNREQCPVEIAGEACYYLCPGQSMTMLSSPTVIPTEPQALVGIDYNMENQDSWAENFFNNNFYNDKYDGFECGDSDTQPEIYMCSGDREARRIYSPQPEIYMCSGDGEAPRIYSPLVSHMRWNNTQPASVEIDDTKSVDIDDVRKLIEDNNREQCPIEIAGEACYYLCPGQSMTMLSSPTVIRTEPQALVGIDYNMENQDSWAENFFNNNFYNDKYDGFGCGDSDTQPEIYMCSGDREARRIYSPQPEIYMCSGDGEAPRIYSSLVSHVRWNNTQP